ncbi:hypothetical protein NXH76_15390 [Blautia schinkii]|nr:hypothetical protein [Blautia schinkii]
MIGRTMLPLKSKTKTEMMPSLFFPLISHFQVISSFVSRLTTPHILTRGFEKYREQINVPMTEIRNITGAMNGTSFISIS